MEEGVYLEINNKPESVDLYLLEVVYRCNRLCRQMVTWWAPGEGSENYKAGTGWPGCKRNWQPKYIVK